MQEKLRLCIISIVFLSLLATSACVSKSAYDETQATLVQTQQEKARVQEDLTRLTSQFEAAKAEVSTIKSTLAQEQGKTSNLTSQFEAAKAEVSTIKSTLAQEQGKTNNLTSQLEAAKAEISRLQKPVRPSLNFVRTTAEVSATGQFTEKTNFKPGEPVTIIILGIIPVHDQKVNYSAQVLIQNNKTGSVMRLETMQPPAGEAASGVSTVTRVTWRRFETQSWEPGQYKATAQILDGIQGTNSDASVTIFTIQ